MNTFNQRLQHTLTHNVTLNVLHFCFSFPFMTGMGQEQGKNIYFYEYLGKVQLCKSKKR